MSRLIYRTAGALVVAAVYLALAVVAVPVLLVAGWLALVDRPAIRAGAYR